MSSPQSLGSPMRPSAVLFDLDGTLLDTAPDLIAALNAVLGDQGCEPVPVEPFRRWVSQGGRRLLKEGFPELDGEGIEALLPSFLSHYDQAIATYTRPYNGVLEVLAELDRASIPWGIVTNKPLGLTRRLLSEIDWSMRTEVVVGGDSLAQRKPHPEPVRFALKALGANSAGAWMVGDDLRDITAGRDAGCRTLIARWGYLDDPASLDSWQADGIVEQPRGLLDWWRTASSTDSEPCST